MKKSITLILAFLLLAAASVVSATDIDKMTNACMAQGENEKVCKCSSIKWMKLLSDSEKQDAELLINMMAENSPPSPSAMIKLAPLLQKYQQVGMECAMNSSYEEEESSVDITNYIPKDTLSDDDASNLNAIISGQGDIMENLQAIDNRQQKAREKERQTRKETQAKSDAELARLRVKVNKEIKRLEKTPILEKSVDDFEALHKMRAELYGNNKQKAHCLWTTMKQVAGDDKPGVLATYFVGIGGGDFDQPSEHRPYLDEAYTIYETYMSKREKCD